MSKNTDNSGSGVVEHFNIEALTTELPVEANGTPYTEAQLRLDFGRSSPMEDDFRVINLRAVAKILICGRGTVWALALTLFLLTLLMTLAVYSQP